MIVSYWTWHTFLVHVPICTSDPYDNETSANLPGLPAMNGFAAVRVSLWPMPWWHSSLRLSCLFSLFLSLSFSPSLSSPSLSSSLCVCLSVPHTPQEGYIPVPSCALLYPPVPTDTTTTTNPMYLTPELPFPRFQQIVLHSFFHHLSSPTCSSHESPIWSLVCRS